MIYFMLVSLGAAFFVSALLTALIRRYAVTRRLLDIPNQRSMHVRPTPRAGGLAILLTFTSGLAFLFAIRLITLRDFAAILGASILVAGVGFWDDYVPLSARTRLLAHSAAALVMIWWQGSAPPLNLGVFVWEWGFWGKAIIFLGLVWLINLNNFMDGIDGLAASEAVFVSIASGVLLYAGRYTGLASISWILGGASAGFLIWNWPPAKIFMGDVGSGFIGLIFGVIILAAMKLSAGNAWIWVILLGVFITDASVTLCTRILHGRRWNEAHRSHAYQKAALRWGHLQVTTAVCLINLLWLTPAAVIVWYHPDLGFRMAALALSPIAALVFYFGAGAENRSIRHET